MNRLKTQKCKPFLGNLLLVNALAMFLFACSSESATNPKEEAEKEKSSIESKEAKTEGNSQEIDTVIPEFKQASDGLEFKVAQYFENKYLKGELTSIVNGMGQKMNPSENKVYLEPQLFEHDGLDFFHMKYPEFLEIKSDSVSAPDRNLFLNSKVNCISFSEGKSSDFLLKKEEYGNGDLQLIISKTFYYRGAYYVHAWTLSNSSEIFHHQRLTFKFNKSQEIIDQSFVNTYQMGYSKASKFLKEINTKQ